MSAFASRKYTICRRMPTGEDPGRTLSPPSYPESPTRLSRHGPKLDPWLGLHARLFLCLLPYSLVALLFVGARLLISSSQVGEKVHDTNSTIWQACYRSEEAVSTLTSFPHLLANNFNSATKKSVDDYVHGLAHVLNLSITALSALLIFLVDMYRSLFLCFLQFVVQAAISLLLSAVELFSSAVHDIAQSIEAAIQASVDAVNTTLRATLGGLNDVLKIIGRSITVPTIAHPSIGALENVTLPSSLQDSLIQLNASLPTLDELKARMNELIQAPFTSLQREINSTIATYSFNQSLLPVPPSRQVGIGLLVLLALLFVLFNLAMEWYNWRSLKRLVQQTKEAYYLSEEQCQDSSSPAAAARKQRPLDDQAIFSLLQLSTHPFLAKWALRGAERVGVKTTQGRNRVRWWLAWICHPVGLLLLVMGLVGLLSVELQIFAVHRIERRYSDRFQNMLEQPSQQAQGLIDRVLGEMSSDYASKSNAVLLQAEDELNQHLFRWVNATTSTMNSTLNEFMDGIATAINQTFSNTPLYTPVQSFIGCIIGQKVAGIEDALGWIQSNAHATFPTVPQDALLPDRNAVQEVMQPLQDRTVGSDGVLPAITGWYLRSLEKEKIMFVILLLLYLFLFLLGSFVAVGAGVGIPGGRKSKLDPSFEEKGVEAQHEHSVSSEATNSHHSISKPLHPDVATLHREPSLRHFYVPS